MVKTSAGRKLIIDEGLRHYVDREGSIINSKQMRDFLVEVSRESGLTVRLMGKGAA